VLQVSTVEGLFAGLRNAAPDTTILLADGTYTLHGFDVNVEVPRITLRGASGNRDSVIIEGSGNNIAIFADDVTVADMTLRGPAYHCVQVHGENGVLRTKIYNVHLLDAGQQFIKVSTGSGDRSTFADEGLVACSLIEYTTTASSPYTNGVDILAGKGWVIRDNVLRRIRGPQGGAGPTILAWKNSMDTVVMRNVLVDCWRGIALGIAEPDAYSRGGAGDAYDHQNGRVENNVIISLELKTDAGIENNFALGSQVFHNTIYTADAAVPWSIECRYAGTTAEIKNNLANRPVVNRSPGSAVSVEAGNVTNAKLNWFHDLAGLDFHLKAGGPAVDGGVLLDEEPEDIDGDARPGGQLPDAGADELGGLPSCADGVTTVGPFVRGDCNGDGAVAGQVTDVIFMLKYSFGGGEKKVPCLAACDANGDGLFGGSVTDPIYLLQYDFLGGTPPPPPFAACGNGSRPGDAALGCEKPPIGCQ